MKKSDLKNLIKECVREIVFEEGAIRAIVTEVTQGLRLLQPWLVIIQMILTLLSGKECLTQNCLKVRLLWKNLAADLA